MPARIEGGKIVLDKGERFVKEGVLKVGPDGKAHLVGTRCASCGDQAFPPMALCANCESLEKMEETLLPLEGRVLTHTRCRTVLPGFSPGYVLAWIKLEGEKAPVLCAQVETDDGEEIEIGARVTMDLGKLKISTKFKGKKLIGPKFRLVKA